MLKGSLALLLLLLLASQTSAAVAHLSEKNFISKIHEKENTLVYIYSSSCNFCKEFTPIFQDLSQEASLQSLNLTFAKMDGPAYENLTHSLHVYSYPSVLLFKKKIPLPIIYRRQRSKKEIVDFLQKNLNSTEDAELLPHFLNMTAEQRVQSKVALFRGRRNSPEFWAWDVIASRDGYIGWAFQESEQSLLLLLGDRQVRDFSNLTQIEGLVQQIYARLHGVTEEAWLKMMQKQKFSIVYFNKHGSKKTRQLVSRMAQRTPSVHFMEIDGNHDEYSPALKALGLSNEENIVAVDRKYDVLYIAPSPYSEDTLKQFIAKAESHDLEPYRKTEKTQKPNKLTRDNFDDRMASSQDILLFLYDKTQPISKQLMKLFQFLVQKLGANKNLLLLRCDVKLNEVEDKLGFVVKPTPKLTYFRNRMRNHPIHFSGKTISASSVIEFIMENTTFDFEDQWAEL